MYRRGMWALCYNDVCGAMGVEGVLATKDEVATAITELRCSKKEVELDSMGSEIEQWEGRGICSGKGPEGEGGRDYILATGWSIAVVVVYGEPVISSSLVQQAARSSWVGK